MSNFSGDPVVKTLPSNAESMGLTLVRELRSYIIHGPKTKTLKKKKRSNKKTKQKSVFNKKTFKN